MDLAKEKFKFKALLSLVPEISDSLHKELEFQRNKMLEMGISGEEISHFIHDSHGREGISRHRAFLVLSGVRYDAGIPDPHSLLDTGRVAHAPSPEADADAYMRLKGGGTKRSPPPSSRQVPKGIAVERPRELEGLAVPYGIDGYGVLVSANDASSLLQYRCLCCGEPLTLRAGNVRVRHFAHKVGSRCIGESALHQIAKELVAKVINELPNSDKQLSMVCSCSKCLKPFDKVLGATAFDHAQNEVQDGAFRCDVMVYRGDQAVLAIEVLNTHAVDQHKGSALQVAWIELDAQDILNNPYHWKPTQDRLKDITCPSCKAKASTIRTIAEKHGQLLPADPYVGAVMRCYRCKEYIVVYWWPGVPFAESAPPLPAPESVQYVSSRAYGGSYWANVCPCCSALQGDNFVFLASDSPFSKLSMRDVGQAMPRVTVQVEGASALFKQKLLKNI